MKNAMKVLTASALVASVGGGIYLFCNPQAKKKIGDAAIKKMDNAQAMVSKKMN